MIRLFKAISIVAAGWLVVGFIYLLATYWGSAAGIFGLMSVVLVAYVYFMVD